MSDKRPETSADIVTRSKAVSNEELGAFGRKRGRDYSVDLPGHMAECDANYVRLLRLFPDLRDSTRTSFAISLPNVQAKVEFKVLEKGPYTTLLKICFADQDKWSGLAAPDMEVRIYHDAQSAEVVAYQSQRTFHGKYAYPNRRMRQRDEKVQINRFLSEFLTLCLAHGVSDQPVSF